MSIRIRKKPWYKDGLNFKCTQCGNCCTGPPGYVWVSSEEIRRISEFTGMAVKAMNKKHLRRVFTRYSLTERANGDCIFLKNEDGKRMCSIYPVRPLQCRTYPFWTVNLSSHREWDDVASGCPGMNSGKHHTYEEIETVRKKKDW